MSSAVDQSRAIRERTSSKSGILYAYEGGIRRVSRGPSPSLVDEVDADWARRQGVDVDGQFTESLPELPLPAGGEQNDDCGDPFPDSFCDRCGDPVYVGRVCGRTMCPRCWEHAVRDQAVEITARLKGRLSYEKAKLPEGKKLGLKPHHVVASVPHDFVTRRSDPLDAAYEVVKEMMVEVGANEGALVYHPYRIRKEYRGDVLGHESGDGDLTWKHILQLIEEIGFERVRQEYLVFNPHFHCLVLSRYVIGGEMTANIHDRSGWVIHRIADDGGASIRDMFDMASVAAYSLSHAGNSETADGRMQTEYRYFGEVSNFEPTDGVRADAKRFVNAVSDTVLGMEFGQGRCPKPSKGVENSSSGDEPIPDDLDPDELDDEYCNGRRLPMRRAQEFLGDSEWVDGAPRSDQLVDALQDWIELTAIKPPPG